MAKATIKDYGTVEFDPMNYDNNMYDLYCVCVCEDEQVVSEEHYTDEDSFRTAINSTYGRELMHELEEHKWIMVTYDHEQYECEVMYHYAYVIDNE